MGELALSETNEQSNDRPAAQQGGGRMTRLRAFLTHLSVSAAIVGSFAAVTLLVWYPPIVFTASEVGHIIAMLVAVDVIIGPTLTFIVFKPGKRGLRGDLAIIIAVQIAAFAYGSATIIAGRPVYLVFAVDRFEAVSAAEIDLTKLGYPELKPALFAGPAPVVASVPADRAESQKVVMEVLFEGKPDIERRPEYYHPYRDKRVEILAAKLDPDIVFAGQAAGRALRSFFATHGGTANDYAFFPLVGRNPEGDAVLALDADTAEPVAAIHVNPWPVKSRDATRKPAGVR